MDFTPVANTGNPVQTQNPLQSLSTIMGLAQQQRSLQLTAQELEQQKIQTQQAQGVNDFFSKVDLHKHIAADGTTDIDSMQGDPAYQNAPGVAKVAITQKLNAIKQQQIVNGQGLMQMGAQALGLGGQVVGAVAKDPDVIEGNENGKAKLRAAVQQWGELGGPPAQKALQPYMAIADGNVKQGDLPIRIAALQRAGDTALQRMGQGTNAAGQNQNVDLLSGARSMPALSGGATNPTTPMVAGATARQVGTGSADIDRANEVGGLQQQSAAAIPLTQRIDQLAHEIGSGNLAKKISETGNYLGFSSVNEARSQLNKDLGQVKGLAVARAGSDQRAATILEGYPTDTTPESTVHAAMDYIRGTARQNLARGRVLAEYQKADPQGLKGFQAADNVVAGQTDPLMHEYQSLKPAEQAGFYRRNFSTPEQAQEFKDKVMALKKHTRVLD